MFLGVVPGGGPQFKPQEAQAPRMGARLIGVEVPHALVRTLTKNSATFTTQF